MAGLLSPATKRLSLKAGLDRTLSVSYGIQAKIVPDLINYSVANHFGMFFQLFLQH